MIRRLTAEDSELIREAWAWDEGRPTWYADMDKVFSHGTVDDLISQLDDWRKVFVGIFNPDLTAVVIIVWCDEGQFEGHLLAKRHTDPQSLIAPISHLLYDTLAFGMKEVNVWVAEKNRAMRRLAESLKICPDGVVMFKGAYKGRVIRWIRHSITREQLNAEEHLKSEVQQPSHVLANSAQ